MLENKMDQLTYCVQQVLDESEIEIVSYSCKDLGYKTPNFTTAGIFNLQGIALVNQKQLPWTMILKIIKPDSAEKEEPQHHNYWRREALVFESKILDELPDSIQAATCYLVEEQKDGTVWLWMEHIEGEYAHTKQDFDFIAEQLGCFNGAYLMAKKIPDQEQERSIWTWFQKFTKQIDRTLNTLNQLPRVLAHQDLSQMNMLLSRTNKGRDLVLIDWQFMSISGIGEDLGKLFGVNMSLGVIPIHRYEEYKESLFQAYIKGAQDMGWQGDERLARYGYCVSTALRSVWEVPQYFKLSEQLASDPLNSDLQERITQLEHIIIIHQKMAFEAEALNMAELFP